MKRCLFCRPLARRLPKIAPLAFSPFTLAACWTLFRCACPFLSVMVSLLLLMLWALFGSNRKYPKERKFRSPIPFSPDRYVLRAARMERVRACVGRLEIDENQKRGGYFHTSSHRAAARSKLMSSSALPDIMKSADRR